MGSALTSEPLTEESGDKAMKKEIGDCGDVIDWKQTFCALFPSLGTVCGQDT